MGITSLAEEIYVVGGVSETGKAFPALVYFAQSDEWQTLQYEGGEFGAYPGMANFGPYLFVVGGEMGAQPVDSNIRYQALYILSLPIIAK
jgi:hypothetical protein